MDEFMPLVAVMLNAGAFDQLTGWNTHNYYLYKKPSTGKWIYLAWDLDVGFSDNAFGQIPVLQGWNAAYPYPVATRPLLKLIVENDQLLQECRQIADDVLETYFSPQVLISKLDDLYELIKPDLADDPFPHVRVTNPEDTDYDSIVASLSDFIQQRFDKSVSELENPIDTPPEEPSDEIPEPGDPSPDAPSNLHVTDTSTSHIALAWTDNATNEGAFIVQRCTGASCSDFQPHIGFPEQNVVSAIDNGVTAGTIYNYRVYCLKPSPSGVVATGPSNIVEAQAID
jgi:hypothetical protein